MPFGKHKGEALSEIPGDYLEWLCKQTDILTELGDAAEDELDRRVRDAYLDPQEMAFCVDDSRAFFG